MAEVALIDQVLIGCLLGERLRIWRSDDRAQILHLYGRGAETLAALLGEGLVSRMSHEPRRFREVATFQEGDGSLFVIAPKDEDPSDWAPIAVVRGELCEAPEPTADLWAAAQQWFRKTYVSAVARGEFMIIETGG